MAGPCGQCGHVRRGHRLYDVPGDAEPWSWCDECGGRCEFVDEAARFPIPAESAPGPLLAPAEMLEMAAIRMVELGYLHPSYAASLTSVTS